MRHLARSVLLLPAFLPGLARAADFEHVLIIIGDDLGTDKVGAYAVDVDNPTESRPSTPTIDMIASAGVRFTDAWATPLCSPSRAWLYTGDYGHRTGIGNVISEGSSTRLAATPPTIMGLAAGSGMATALLGKWHVGETTRTLDAAGTVTNYKEYPVQVGFEFYAGNMDGEPESYTDWLYTVSEPSGSGARYRTTATDETTPIHDMTTDDAETWMVDEAGSQRFTVVSYNLTHHTRAANGRRSWGSGATACGRADGTDVQDAGSMTECLDEEVAELLAGTPDLETTLVIFLGDNGTARQVAEGNFDDDRGKETVYENGIRVPLIFADGAAVQAALDNGGTLPSNGSYVIDAGTVVSDPSSIVDIYATVADFLDLSTTSCTPGSTCARDSQTLRSVLTGGAAVRDTVWSELFSRVQNSYRGAAAVRSGDFKLVIDVATGGAACRAYEMYDLANDRWETNDLFDDPAYSTEQAALLGLVDAQEATMSVAWLPAADCS